MLVGLTVALCVWRCVCYPVPCGKGGRLAKCTPCGEAGRLAKCTLCGETGHRAIQAEHRYSTVGHAGLRSGPSPTLAPS